jgi:integrase
MTKEPAREAGRMRNSAVNLTDKLCESKVDKRTKKWDKKCSGFYVSITPAGVATFSLKITNPQTHKQPTFLLGVYNRESFTVEDARGMAYAMKAKGGAAAVESYRQQKVTAAKRGVIVDQVITERVEWMKTLVQKRDGEMRPRIESWENVESHLRRFVSPRLGRKLASEITKSDIAQLSNAIVAGEFGKPSVSNARHMRRAASALFSWAAEAGRDYATASPCVNLPPLDEEYPRERVLSKNEIRTLWHGLDREDMPWDRRTRLAIKFALVSMLRSGELLPIHRDELNAENGTVDIAARRVKKGRVINQPLSDLAMEIIKEALSDDGQQYVFKSPLGDQPMERKTMATALRGTMYKNGKTKSAGICELLGLAPFAPHDLRRTGATLCGELGLSEADIGLTLDHQANRDENGKPLPAVTNKVYNLATSARVARKRKVLDAWAVALRRIVSEPATELRLVA